jgi:hypothetical protein
MQDLNLRPPACEAGALPTELIVRACDFRYLQVSRQAPFPPFARECARERPGLPIPRALIIPPVGRTVYCGMRAENSSNTPNMTAAEGIRSWQ